jgi:hypothetical protein
LSFAVRVFLVAAFGALLGLGSAHLAIEREWLVSRQHFGPWATAVGSAQGEVDPYSAAILARTGVVPLGPAEGIAYVGEVDSTGLPLDPRCHYTIAGPLPLSALWTLVATDASGRTADGPLHRFGFTSRDAVRAGATGVRITVGPTVRPWNYLPTAGLETLVLTLRIYGAPSSADAPVDAGSLPRVTRETCL